MDLITRNTCILAVLDLQHGYPLLRQVDVLEEGGEGGGLRLPDVQHDGVLVQPWAGFRKVCKTGKILPGQIQILWTIW